VGERNLELTLESPELVPALDLETNAIALD
jgi:hypothetical protein